MGLFDGVSIGDMALRSLSYYQFLELIKASTPEDRKAIKDFLTDILPDNLKAGERDRKDID